MALLPSITGNLIQLPKLAPNSLFRHNFAAMRTSNFIFEKKKEQQQQLKKQVGMAQSTFPMLMKS